MNRVFAGLMPISAWLMGAMTVAVLSGCGSTGSQVEKWQLTESQAPSAAEKIPGAARQPVRVVFFREAGSGAHAQTPVNLYINGQYQASLVGNTYTEQALCPGQHGLAVQMSDVNQRYTTKQHSAPVTVGLDAVQYFRVSEDAAGVARVTTAPADTTLPSLRLLQRHTIPRIVRNGCATV